MKIKSVLVCQPVPTSDNSPYYEIEKRNKIKFFFRPFIKIIGLQYKDVRQQKIDFNKVTAIIFTSRNAIDHFFRLALEARIQIPDSMKYFCESEAIALYLQKYIVYRKRKVYIGEKTFSDMIPLFKKNHTEKYLLPASNVLNNYIREVLKELNIDYQIVTLFKTVSNDISDIFNIDYDMLVFFSPYDIISLYDNFPNFNQGKIKIAVFGKYTVKEALKRNLDIHIKVPTQKCKSMIMALDNYFSA